MNLFNMDNPIFRMLGKMVDTVILSALWVIFSIPVFTMGAASTALYYTVHKTLRRNRGYIYSNFWSSFKSNFKQSTLMWLILMAVYAIFGVDLYLTWQFLQAGMQWGVMFYLFLVLILMTVVWTIYIVAYSARFENTKKTTMKNAAAIAVVNLGWSFLILLLFLISAVIFFLIPVLIFLVPAVTALLYDVILERIFRRYMTEEDLAAERESDMIDMD